MPPSVKGISKLRTLMDGSFVYQHLFFTCIGHCINYLEIDTASGKSTSVSLLDLMKPLFGLLFDHLVSFSRTAKVKLR